MRASVMAQDLEEFFFHRDADINAKIVLTLILIPLLEESLWIWMKL